ncbi:complexin-3 isoform X2 [Papio anubis]|uniref:complexin-3 isoform X2 n=1 Tax=Papio anubis TaxID=9555 RepID=UPI000B7AF723|nr:complexin-3 isoform X2 [Papio anubis]
MAFMVKTMVGGQLKNLTGSLGGGEDKGDGDKSAAEAQGMSREEYEEYQKQLVEEKMERDAQFTQRKAERATLRSHFRDKYRLPKVICAHQGPGLCAEGTPVLMKLTGLYFWSQSRPLLSSTPRYRHQA